MVAFESLQGLKGSVYFGGNYQKLEWMAKSYNDLKGITHHGIDFDLLVIDEAQEGIDTIRTNMPLKISAENIRFIYQARRLRLLLPDSFQKNRFITGPMRMSRNEKHPGKAMTIIPMKFCRSFPCTRTRFLV